MVYQLFVYNKKELTTWHMGIDWACESTSGGEGHRSKRAGGARSKDLERCFVLRK